MPQVIEQGHITHPWERVWECPFCHRKLKFSKEEFQEAKGNYHKNPDQLSPTDWRAFTQFAGLSRIMQGPCDTCETVRDFTVAREREE